MAKLSPVLNGQLEDANGAPLVGGKIYTYAAGSSTPQATYTSAAGDVPQANPIILNALGMPDSPIWDTEGQAYKYVVKDANDVTLFTIDNVTGVGDTSVDIDQWNASGVTPTYVSATSFTVPGDQTSAFHANRRFKATTTGGTVYGAFQSASYDGSSLTTVNTVNDSGSLDSGLSAISLGVVTATNTSMPKIPNFTDSTGLAADAVKARHLADAALGFSMVNGTLTAVPALNALTVAIKTDAGNDPSTDDPVLVRFLNTSGGYDVLSLTAATSLVISSGSTLGTSNGVSSRLWVVGINDSGTFRLGVINLGAATNVIADDLLGSSSAEGGAGAADSAGVIYTDASATSKPIRVLGFFDSTQATAGTWVTAPSKIQLVSSVYTSSPSNPAYVYIRDEKTAGTAGGSSSATTWHTRTLNTEVADSGGVASLSSNQITLAAGTYRVKARAPAHQAVRHKLRLRNTTAGTTLLVGANAYASATVAAVTDASLMGRITVAASQVLELQHYIEGARATDGLGLANSAGEVEVYAEIEFIKEF